MITTEGLIAYIVIIVLALATVVGSNIGGKYLGSSDRARLRRARLRFGCRAYVTPFEVGDGRMEYMYSLGVYDRLKGRHISYELYMDKDWTKLNGNSKWMALQFAKKDYYDFLRGWVRAEFAEKDAAKAKRAEAKKFAATKHRVR